MKRFFLILFYDLFFLVFSISMAYSHLCDNVFRQQDKLIVKPQNYNIVVKDEATFKIFLQNNMDRAIAEISLLAESPAFEFTVTPEKMSVPRNQRVFFSVTVRPLKDRGCLFLRALYHLFSTVRQSIPSVLFLRLSSLHS